MKLFLTLLFAVLCGFTYSQSWIIDWQNSLGGTSDDKAQSIEQTLDGGYIVAGNSWSVDGDVNGNNGSNDYWVVKQDASGSIQWEKTLGGSGNDYAQAIQQTDDLGFIVVGASNSNDGDVSVNYGGNDFWVVKLDGLGNILWEKSLGGTNDEQAYSVTQTIDGGYVIAGYSNSNDGDVSGNNGLSDYWIVKLDPSGNLLWQDSYGGSLMDYGTSVKSTDDGGVVVAGYSRSSDGDLLSVGNAGLYDYWILKLDVSGNILWERSTGGSDNDYAQSIKQTVDGGYIVAGASASCCASTSHIGGMDYWIVKLNSSGVVSWERSLGGSEDDYAFSVTETSDGGYAVAGTTFSSSFDVTTNNGFSDYWVVKLDGTGNIDWKKSLGGSDFDVANDIKQTSDGAYVIAGYTSSNDMDVTGNNGDDDYWVVKLTLGCENFTGTDTRTECAPFTWIDGIDYTQNNNTATHNIIGGAANGCDSLVTLNLTIVSPNVTSNLWNISPNMDVS